MTDAYREDLAYIHDVGFGHLAKNAAPILLEALRPRLAAGLLLSQHGCAYATT